MVSPIRHQVAAISCGVVEDTPCLDLCYQEDSHAQVDMNFVMNDEGNFIEMQGTGEGRAFTPEELQTLMAYGRKGIVLMAGLRHGGGVHGILNGRVLAGSRRSPYARHDRDADVFQRVLHLLHQPLTPSEMEAFRPR